MSIRKILLTTSTAALLSGAALADGGPVPESPPPPPPPPAEEEPYSPPPPVETAAENVWYAALHGGAVWLDDMEFDVFGNLFVTDMDTGWAAGGALGYRYGNGFRAEFEGTWRDNDGLVSDGLLVGDAEISALNLMLNGLYDFDMGGGFSPYIGAGVGAARVDATFDFPEQTEEDDGWAFAYQFIGGVSVPMPNTAIEFFADYRYMSTAGLELDFDGDAQDNDDYRAHTVLGGVRFNF